AGSFFDDAQVRSSARVVVLAPTTANTLFGDEPATMIGEKVRINHQTFEVVGVLDSAGEPADSAVVMPLNTARRYVFGVGDNLNQLLVKATQAATVPAARNQVIDILSDRHRINDPARRDFEVQSFGSRLNAFNQILNILTLFTVSVAAISLFV